MNIKGKKLKEVEVDGKMIVTEFRVFGSELYNGIASIGGKVSMIDDDDVICVPEINSFRLSDISQLMTESFSDGSTSGTITGAQVFNACKDMSIKIYSGDYISSEKKNDGCVG